MQISLINRFYLIDLLGEKKLKNRSLLFVYATGEGCGEGEGQKWLNIGLV